MTQSGPLFVRPPIDLFDRDATRRLDPQLWVGLESRVLVAKRGSIAALHGRPLWLDADAAPEGERIYLGQARSVPQLPAGVALEVRLLPDDAELSNGQWIGLRQLVGAVPAELIELGATAIALANWRSTHRRCPGCGTPLTLIQGGWALSCGDCGAQVFPRTDPAVIVRVLDEAGRILLGSNAAWEAGRYSLLAGFVEPGESLEQAVIREVFEESGVPVIQPRYLASQAWPFPLSLMLGFEAKATATPLHPDGEEIVELRWFDREQILGDGIILPGPGSLARHIVEDWFGGPLPESSPLL